MRYPSEIYTIEELRKIQILLEMSLEDDLIFPNQEFPTLTGVTIQEAKRILNHWPNCDLEDKLTYLTVSGILGNLIGYPHKRGDLIWFKTSLEATDFSEFRSRLKSVKPDFK